MASSAYDRLAGAVWRIHLGGGRTDDCVMYIAQGLAALSAGKTWQEAAGTQSPWGLREPTIQDNWLLAGLWEEIMAIRNEVGPKAFHDLARRLKVTREEYLAFLDFHWGNQVARRIEPSRRRRAQL